MTGLGELFCGAVTYMIFMCSCLQQMMNAEDVLAKLNAGGYSVRGKCQFISIKFTKIILSAG